MYTYGHTSPEPESPPPRHEECKVWDLGCSCPSQSERIPYGATKPSSPISPRRNTTEQLQSLNRRKVQSTSRPRVDLNLYSSSQRLLSSETGLYLPCGDSRTVLPDYTPYWVSIGLGFYGEISGVRIPRDGCANKKVPLIYSQISSPRYIGIKRSTCLKRLPCLAPAI